MKGIKHLVVAFCTFLDWVAYLSLLCICLSITWHVVDKFRSKSTNILQYEEPITKRPVITFCFDGKPFWRFNSRYGEDFQLDHIVKDGVDDGNGDFSPLELGENGQQNATIKIFLKAVATMGHGQCYQLKTTNVDKSALISNVWNQITIRFLSIETNPDLPDIKFFITSEENSYGVVKRDWRNGEVLTVELEPNNLKRLDLNVQKQVFLKSTTKCKDETFYECLTPYVMRANFTGCPKGCIPGSLPNQNYVPCDFEERNLYENYKCNTDIFKDIWQDLLINNTCPRTCTTTEYSGKVVLEKSNTGTEVDLGYKFAEPEITTVHEEYVLFDVIDMICNVGGTLGLFIGFSISNAFTVLLGYVQILMLKIFNRNFNANIIQHEEKSNFLEVSYQKRLKMIEFQLARINKIIKITEQ